MTNLTARFIITETPNGRSTPSSVWEADNEAYYVSRVREANSRSDGAWELETAEQAAEFTAERDACRVALIDEAEFNSEPIDSWDSRIVKKAVQLGWIAEQAEEN